MSETITLTPKQEEKAKELLESVSTNTKPQQLVDTWKPAPSRAGLTHEEKQCKFVKTADIVGTEKHNLERLESKRLKKILKQMINGQFELKHRLPPVLCKINGKYYVDADGNHRVLVHKALNIEEIYAEALVYK